MNLLASISFNQSGHCRFSVQSNTPQLVLWLCSLSRLSSPHFRPSCVSPSAFSASPLSFSTLFSPSQYLCRRFRPFRASRHSHRQLLCGRTLFISNLTCGHRKRTPCTSLRSREMCLLQDGDAEMDVWVGRLRFRTQVSYVPSFFCGLR